MLRGETAGEREKNSKPVSSVNSGRGAPYALDSGIVPQGLRAVRANCSSRFDSPDRPAQNASTTVAVAQLVERQVVVLDVAGSSPVGHPLSSRQYAVGSRQ